MGDPITVNEKLLAGGLRHEIGLARYSTSQVKSISKLLDESTTDLLKKLEARKEAILKTGKDRGPYVTARLEAMLDEIQVVNAEAYDLIGKELTSEMKKLAGFEAEWATTNLKNAMPIRLSFVRPTAEQLNAIVTDLPMTGDTLLKGISKAARSRFEAIQGQVALGLVQGETVDQIVRRARTILTDLKKSQVETLVRTAVIHTTNAARRALYQANSDVIKAELWDATLDRDTCPTCRGLDGMTFPLDEGPRPPAHYRCRCTTAPVTKSWKELGIQGKELGDLGRASMDGRIPKRKSFTDWLRGAAPSLQDDILGPKRGLIFRANPKLQLHQLLDQDWDELTLAELAKKEGILVPIEVDEGLHLISVSKLATEAAATEALNTAVAKVAAGEVEEFKAFVEDAGFEWQGIQKNPAIEALREKFQSAKKAFQESAKKAAEEVLGKLDLTPVLAGEADTLDDLLMLSGIATDTKALQASGVSAKVLQEIEERFAKALEGYHAGLQVKAQAVAKDILSGKLVGVGSDEINALVAGAGKWGSLPLHVRGKLALIVDTAKDNWVGKVSSVLTPQVVPDSLGAVQYGVLGNTKLAKALADGVDKDIFNKAAWAKAITDDIPGALAWDVAEDLLKVQGGDVNSVLKGLTQKAKGKATELLAARLASFESKVLIALDSNLGAGGGTNWSALLTEAQGKFPFINGGPEKVAELLWYADDAVGDFAHLVKLAGAFDAKEWGAFGDIINEALGEATKKIAGGQLLPMLAEVKAAKLEAYDAYQAIAASSGDDLDLLAANIAKFKSSTKKSREAYLAITADADMAALADTIKASSGFSVFEEAVDHWGDVALYRKSVRESLEKLHTSKLRGLVKRVFGKGSEADLLAAYGSNEQLTTLLATYQEDIIKVVLEDINQAKTAYLAKVAAKKNAASPAMAGAAPAPASTMPGGTLAATNPGQLQPLGHLQVLKAKLDAAPAMPTGSIKGLGPAQGSAWITQFRARLNFVSNALDDHLLPVLKAANVPDHLMADIGQAWGDVKLLFHGQADDVLDDLFKAIQQAESEVLATYVDLSDLKVPTIKALAQAAGLDPNAYYGKWGKVKALVVSNQRLDLGVWLPNSKLVNYKGGSLVDALTDKAKAGLPDQLFLKIGNDIKLVSVTELPETFDELSAMVVNASNNIATAKSVDTLAFSVAHAKETLSDAATLWANLVEPAYWESAALGLPLDTYIGQAASQSAITYLTQSEAMRLVLVKRLAGLSKADLVKVAQEVQGYAGAKLPQLSVSQLSGLTKKQLIEHLVLSGSPGTGTSVGVTQFDSIGAMLADEIDKAGGQTVKKATLKASPNQPAQPQAPKVSTAQGYTPPSYAGAATSTPMPPPVNLNVPQVSLQEAQEAAEQAAQAAAQKAKLTIAGPVAQTEDLVRVEQVIGNEEFIAGSVPKGAELYGKPWTKPDATWYKDIPEVTGIAEPAAAPYRAGLIVREADGRIWVSNFDGPSAMPQVQLQAGETAQKAALRGVWERTGLETRITGYAGDFKDGANVTRFYYAERVGGTPTLGSNNTFLTDLDSAILQFGKDRDKAVAAWAKAQITGDAKDLIFAQELAAKTGSTVAQAGGPPALPKVRNPWRVETLDGSDWKATGRQAGSNPGGLYEAADGSRFYVKFPPNAEHAAEELVANRLYQAAGLDVPEVHLVKVNGKVGIASRIVDGQTGLKPSELAKLSRVTDGFITDAWMGNWDVAGMSFDNILVTSAGHAFRIDPGGALRFRAQGALKAAAEFAENVGELKTMLSASSNAQTAAIFSGLTPQQIVAQIRKLEARFTDELITKVLGSVPGLKTPDTLRAVLIKRRHFLATYADTLEKKLEGEAVALARKAKAAETTYKVNTDDSETFPFWNNPWLRAWRDKLNKASTTVKEAVRRYTGNGFADWNRALWANGYKNGEVILSDLSAAQAASSKAMDTLLDEAIIEDAVTVWRGSDGGGGSTLEAYYHLKAGDFYHDHAYMSSASHRSKAWPKPMLFEMRLPKGFRGAAYVDDLPADKGWARLASNSSYRGEREVLVRRNVRWRVVEVKKSVRGQTHGLHLVLEPDETFMARR